MQHCGIKRLALGNAVCIRSRAAHGVACESGNQDERSCLRRNIVVPVDLNGSFSGNDIMQNCVFPPTKPQRPLAVDFAKGKRLKIDFERIEYVIVTNYPTFSRSRRIGVNVTILLLGYQETVRRLPGFYRRVECESARPWSLARAVLSY